MQQYKHIIQRWWLKEKETKDLKVNATRWWLKEKETKDLKVNAISSNKVCNVVSMMSVVNTAV